MSKKKKKYSEESKKKSNLSKGGSRKKNKKKSLKQNKKINNYVLSRIMDVIFFLIIILMLSGSFLFMISQKEDKTIAGYRFYDVLTNSMVKTKPEQKGNFNSGDMIIIKSTKPEDIEVGDIITFVPNSDSKDTFLTHRVIKKVENKGESKKKENVPSFITQGDANNSPDPEVSGKNVIGKKVLVIPKAGKIVKSIREHLVLSLVFVISLFLLVFIIKGYFEEVKKSKRKSRRKKNEKVKKK